MTDEPRPARDPDDLSPTADELTPSPDAPSDPPAPAISGVAAGNLGTGTALDDTQRYRVNELIAESPIDALGEPEPPPVVPSQAPVARTSARLIATPPPPRLAQRGTSRIVGLAAVAGAVALIVLAATALFSNHGISPGAGQTLATFAIGVDGSTPSPSPDVANTDRGNGNGNGNGNKTHKP